MELCSSIELNVARARVNHDIDRGVCVLQSHVARLRIGLIL